MQLSFALLIRCVCILFISNIHLEVTDLKLHFLFETLSHTRVAGERKLVTVKQLAWLWSFTQLTVEVSSCTLLLLVWFSSLVYLG